MKTTIIAIILALAICVSALILSPNPKVAVLETLSKRIEKLEIDIILLRDKIIGIKEDKKSEESSNNRRHQLPTYKGYFYGSTFRKIY